MYLLPNKLQSSEFVPNIIIRGWKNFGVILNILVGSEQHLKYPHEAYFLDSANIKENRTVSEQWSVQKGGQTKKIKIALVQGTPWGFPELECNGQNVFQEVFHIGQVVSSLPYSCGFSCDFANW